MPQIKRYPNRKLYDTEAKRYVTLEDITEMIRSDQDIHVTDVMYTLKRMSVRAGLVDDTDAPDFSKTFIGFVERYGRSFEFGLATRYHLAHKPLRKVSVGPLALKLLAKDRLQLRPRSIRGIKQLQAILERAKELGGV